MKCAFTEQVDSLNSSFKTLSVGHIASRVTGEAIGEIDAKTLKELVRVFYASRDRDPVIIDWGHNSSPDEDSSSPESSVALGEVVDLYIEGDGLWVRPRYSERTKKIIEEAGPIWSSPELIMGPVYDRETGIKIGDAQLLAVALTSRPQQTMSKISRVTLEESMESDISQEVQEVAEADAMKAQLDALMQENEALRAELSLLKGDGASLEEESSEDDKDDDGTALAEGNSAEDKEKDESEDSTSLKERLLLREQTRRVSQLETQLAKLTADRDRERMQTSIMSLCEKGKISPHEVTQAERLYKLDSKLFSEMFDSRPENHSVDLTEYGHGYGAAETPTAQTLDAEIKRIQQTNNVKYSEALALLRAEKPSAFLKL